MRPERWRQVEALFNAASEQKPDRRGAFLAEACHGDVELRQEVESLLGRDGSSDGVLDRPAWAAAPSLMESPSLGPGTQLGPYQILGPLGAGGMGEVYRARDPRLKRDVAVKVSRERFSDRFEREARAVAALNHPNICTLYDVGPNYLVMELIEGEPPKGPLPLEEVLRIARQIADALDAAHEKGIIHRDLKPGNIKIKPDGTVKVLDFGLAKTVQLTSGDPESSPTATVSPTRAGMIMGTAAYMSPEQARGKAVDKRSDIWAFGVVLYELLTGRRPFRGEDVSDTLASVMKDEPDLSRVPVQARRLLKSCLEKDSKKRLRDIGDAWRLLEDSSVSRFVPARRWIWATLLLALIAAVLGVFALLRPTPSAEAYRLAITPPPGVDFEFDANVGGSAISPDGKRLAFVAGGDLWVRPLDSETAIKLAGTHGAYYPFWSPDQRSIGFFATGQKLMRTDLPSGPTVELAVLETTGRGGSWNADGTILYAETGRSISRIPSTGGKPTRLSKLDESKREMAYNDPSFLPDGDRYLYLIHSREAANTGIYLGSLKDPTLKKRVLTARSNAAYVVPSRDYPGYLVFYREGVLVAQPFDSKTLRSTGEPQVLSDSVGYLLNNGLANFSVSPTGAVVIGTLGTPKMQMTWLDRRGNETTVMSSPDYYSFPRISPDSSRVVLHRWGGTAVSSLWIFDFNRGALSLVSDAGGYPAWSGDGRHIIYDGYPEKALVRKDLDSPRPAEIAAPLEGDLGDPIDWSPDAKFAVVAPPHGLVALALGDRAASHQLTRGNDHSPRFSPDGKWLAYQSRESAKFEVFVQDFPDGRTRKLVSNQGGEFPIWRRDQKEFFYRAANSLMAVDVRSGTSGLEFGVPHALFSRDNFGASVCDGTPDGQRFLCLFQVAKDARDNRLTVLINWRVGLRR